MHTIETKNCVFIHNDCSGEIEISRASKGRRQRIVLEFADLVTFMGNVIRESRISQLEQQPAHELLGLESEDSL